MAEEKASYAQDELDSEIMKRLQLLEVELKDFRVLLQRYRVRVTKTLLEAGEQAEGGVKND